PARRGARANRVRFLLAALSLSMARRDALVYTRDLGIAAFLLQMPASRRARVIYESHGIAPMVSAEMPRLLGRPDLIPSVAKLRRLDRRERRVWTRAAAYVTITHALAEDLTARYGSGARVFVVPDGAPSPAVTVAAAPGTIAGPPIVGYAGHLYPWKGVDILVHALALLPQVHGLIVGGHPGEADRARVEALARTLGVGDRLRITGLVPPAEVTGHLSQASILVLPNVASAISERYTSPLKLFEYLWMNRPIIASDLASIREVLTDRVTALLVPPGDSGRLAAAITELVADDTLAARLAGAARALAPAFTWAERARHLDAALAAARA
ncbi:MAG: glycosyltransferase family 4 protein, partial [Acidobacteriota bacterium]